MSRAKNEWVREGLQRRGYRQKDVAVAWASQQATVSRFIAGEELQDLQLSKALSLARMLGITVEELAKGLGLHGVEVEPTVPGGETPAIPLGTMNMSSPRPGVTRLEMRKDFSVKAAQEIIGIMSTDVLPS
ncbi:helix-turn-helix domain-containing protein [Rhizobium favelukesii]|uniref:helix-turn-helix domain-containing protein n=1 Tax=Rhizobium favelukesii TaxID=348824 RepID=UPI00055D0D4C|nr:helix-turn-helix transcriptional regulator [Rhizobium favelukesii]MCS0459299.1 helix-turn-helix domain-containing protein [Rhizobium favelukesii]